MCTPAIQRFKDWNARAHRLNHSLESTPTPMKLKEVIASLAVMNPATTVNKGFNNPHSWRGIYAELSFEPAEYISVGDMLKAAQSAVGATYEGWKGGSYTMGLHTNVHLDREGEWNDQGEGLESLMAALSAPTPIRVEASGAGQELSLEEFRQVLEYWAGDLPDADIADEDAATLLGNLGTCGMSVLPTAYVLALQAAATPAPLASPAAGVAEGLHADDVAELRYLESSLDSPGCNAIGRALALLGFPAAVQPTAPVAPAGPATHA